MREFEVGSSLPRYEDLRLTRGRGRYTDDFSFTGQTHLYLLRSPHAAATIKSIDTSAAKEAPGVVAIYTGADLETDGIGGIRCRMRRKHPNGEPSFEPPYPALAVNAVHYVGDAVVAVIAETMADAKSAAELVEIDYENLPAAATLEEATADGAPAVWQEAPDNICFLQELGNKAAVDQTFAKAKHVVQERFRISRVATNSMEPRDAIGLYDQGDNRFTLYAGLQSRTRATRRAGADHLQGSGQPDACHLAGHRRRLRHERRHVSRTDPGAVGRAQARPAGEMDQRSQRVVPVRFSGARQRFRRFAARSMRTASFWRCSVETPGQPRRLYVRQRRPGRRRTMSAVSPAPI